MKKFMMLILTLVCAVIVGSAFGAEKAAAPERSAGLYNGITYFDLGPASTCPDDAAGPAERTSAVKPFNGITAFDLGQPGSGARGSCAGQKAERTPAGKSYNGITVF